MVILPGLIDYPCMDFNGLPGSYETLQFYKVLTIDIYSIVLFPVSLDAYSGNLLNWSVYPVASLLLIWVYFLLVFLLGKRHPFVLAFMAYISTGYTCIQLSRQPEVLVFDLALPIITDSGSGIAYPCPVAF